MTNRQIRMLLICALFPIGFGVFTSLLFLCVALIQISFESGEVLIPNAATFFGVLPIALIVAAPIYVLMFWWLIRSWRE